MDDIVIRASTAPRIIQCELSAAGKTIPHIFAQHGYVLPQPKITIGALIGSAVHMSAEVGFNAKLIGRRASRGECADAGVQEFLARRDEEMGQGTEFIMDETAGTSDVAVRQVERLSYAYLRQVIDVTDPIAVERRITADFAPGILVSGQADLLAIVRTDSGGEGLHDLKTTKWPSNGLKHLAQQGTYSLLLQGEGHMISEAVIDEMTRVPIGKHQPAVRQIPLNVAVAERVAHRALTQFAGDLLEFAKDGDPLHFTANPSDSLCNPKYCRLHGTEACPVTRRDR